MPLLPKHPKRRKRLALIALMITGIGSAVALATIALKENINLFYGPTQILAGEAPKNHAFRIGGMVEMGSVKRNRDNRFFRKKVEMDVKDSQPRLTCVCPAYRQAGLPVR